eukprot:scaffold1439_cov298-Pavlova_lutheri.AAC.1
MEENEPTTRIGTLRQELERERNEQTSLAEKVAELEAQLEALPAVFSNEDEEGEGCEVINKSDEEMEDEAPQQPFASPEENGLPRLTSLYGTSLLNSKNIQKVSLEKPEKFTGEELDDNPYALTYWIRDVSCWCQAYAYDRPKEQLVLAINQALAGTAKSMACPVELCSECKRVSSLLAAHRSRHFSAPPARSTYSSPASPLQALESLDRSGQDSRHEARELGCHYLQVGKVDRLASDWWISGRGTKGGHWKRGGPGGEGPRVSFGGEGGYSTPRAMVRGRGHVARAREFVQVLFLLRRRKRVISRAWHASHRVALARAKPLRKTTSDATPGRLCPGVPLVASAQGTPGRLCPG